MKNTYVLFAVIILTFRNSERFRFVSSLLSIKKKLKYQNKKINLGQSAQAESLPQTRFFPRFYQMHGPPTQQLAESIIVLERLDNRNLFILQNITTAGKTFNYNSVHYPKSLLISIKQIRSSQLYLFFQVLNYSSANTSRLLSTHELFSVHRVSIILFHEVIDLPKKIFVGKA